MGAMSLVRLAIGVPVAAVVTFFLFTLMRALIFTEGTPPEDAGENIVIDILQTREDSAVRTREERPEKPDEINAPPPPPRIEAAKAEAPDEGLAETLGRLPGLDPESVDQGDVAFVVADRDVQPLVRVQNYPQRALERGMSGSCDVDLDVDPNGTPQNVRVSCTSSLFASQAKRDVEKWKYAPKIVDGQGAWQYNLKNKIDYELED